MIKFVSVKIYLIKFRNMYAKVLNPLHGGIQYPWWIQESGLKISKKFHIQFQDCNFLIILSRQSSLPHPPLIPSTCQPINLHPFYLSTHQPSIWYLQNNFTFMSKIFLFAFTLLLLFQNSYPSPSSSYHISAFNLPTILSFSLFFLSYFRILPFPQATILSNFLSFLLCYSYITS